jgi:hypothetical protein
MLRAPFSSEFDPSEEAEGSIDPLGLQPGYKRLADKLLPAVEPLGLSLEPDLRHREEEHRYPVVQFRDGLALLGRLPRSPAPETRHWSPVRGFD